MFDCKMNQTLMKWIFLESYKSWSISLWDLNHFWLISDQLWISDQDETGAGFFWSCCEVSRVPTPSLMNLSTSDESDYSLTDGGYLQHEALVMLHLLYFHVNPHDTSVLIRVWMQKLRSGWFWLLQCVTVFNHFNEYKAHLVTAGLCLHSHGVC